MLGVAYRIRSAPGLFICFCVLGWRNDVANNCMESMNISTWQTSPSDRVVFCHWTWTLGRSEYPSCTLPAMFSGPVNPS